MSFTCIGIGFRLGEKCSERIRDDAYKYYLHFCSDGTCNLLGPASVFPCLFPTIRTLVQLAFSLLGRTNDCLKMIFFLIHLFHGPRDKFFYRCYGDLALSWILFKQFVNCSTAAVINFMHSFLELQ